MHTKDEINNHDLASYCKRTENKSFTTTFECRRTDLRRHLQRNYDTDPPHSFFSRVPDFYNTIVFSACHHESTQGTFKKYVRSAEGGWARPKTFKKNLNCVTKIRFRTNSQ